MADEETVSAYGIKTYAGKKLPENYHNYVLVKWLRSFRFGNDYIKLTDSDSYYTAYSRYIKSILESPLVAIRLAVLVDDEDVTLGFSVVSGETLHYVYVGRDYRSQGIGAGLVPDSIKEFTHLTKKGMRIWSLKAPKAVFNPFH